MSKAASDLTPYLIARWRLAGGTLPRIQETIEVGALTRRALMSQGRKFFGAENVPEVLSGHGFVERNRHEHLFCLPEDADGDGRIDHIIAFCRGGFDNRTLRCLAALEHLWAGAWGEWEVLEHWIAKPGETLGTLTGLSRQWLSVTPFFPPRHLKRKYDEAAQIRWQCFQMGLPEPLEITQADNDTTSTRISPSNFRMLRSGQENMPPVRTGGYWRLDFAGPVPGPIALGYGCHFGLGAFRPLRYED